MRFCVGLYQDKQQAAWYDGASLMTEDHSDGHMERETKSRVVASKSTSSSKDPSEKAELDRIDGMLYVKPCSHFSKTESLHNLICRLLIPPSHAHKMTATSNSQEYGYFIQVAHVDQECMLTLYHMAAVTRLSTCFTT
jgi:hypothetical protein